MRIAAASLVLLFASSAQAAENDTHAASANRLAQASIQFQQEDGASLSCVPDRAALRAELKGEFLALPSRFGGISPQSQYWPDVEELNYQRRLASCSSKALSQAWADSLAAELTTADMDAATAFYESPIGQRLLAASARASKVFLSQSRVPTPQQVEADRAYLQAMRELTVRYTSEPK